MSSRIPSLFILFFGAVALNMSAYAHEYTVGALKIAHPFARASVAGQTTGGAYLSVENTGKDADKLLSMTSSAAKTVEIHSMTMDGNMMKMRQVDALTTINPAATINMTPGNGYHIMLIGLAQPLKAGDKFPITLIFEKAGKIEVMVNVEGISAKKTTAPATHQH